MAVLGRLLVGSAERLDLPDLLSLDSYTAADFKYLIQSFIGSDKPYVLKGFDVIQPQDAIGTESISIRVADSVTYYPVSGAGSFYYGLEEGNPNAEALVPELRKNATNFVYLTFNTFDTAQDSRAFWDPDQNGGEGGEFSQDVNTESVLKVEVNVSVSVFPENTIPICKVTVGSSVIESIQDCRDMMFRLGTGGVAPNPFSDYNFRNDPSSTYARSEPPTLMTSALDPNPFQGGDKNIYTLKEWMDVVMTRIKEISGDTYWYEGSSPSPTPSNSNIFLDALASTIKSKGEWIHSGSVAGQAQWTEDIHYYSLKDPRDLIIRASTINLSNDDEVAWLDLVRDVEMNNTSTPVTWANGSVIVNGIVSSFQNLAKGDWVKKKSDSGDRFLRVEEFYASANLGGGVTTPALAQSIRLNDTYAGSSGPEIGDYTKGEYILADINITSRDDASIQAAGGNFYWIAYRSDTVLALQGIVGTQLTIDITEADGQRARVESTVAHGLVDGDRITVAAGTYAGTWTVEVEDTTNFFIETSLTGNSLGQSAFYAVVTTAARATPYSFSLETANHGFQSNEHIEIDNTSSAYDGDYVINVRSATTFQIPVPSLIANPGPIDGLIVRLPRLNVRTEFGTVKIVQGESINIGDADSKNILTFVGMESLAQTKPRYFTPLGYNAINGHQNFNADADDNLTVRAAKLTAMMADRVQDRGVQIVGRTNITSVTSGADQNISALANLTLVKPSSPDQTITLTTPLALPANSAIVADMDRNASTSITPVVVSLGSQFLLQENRVILFYRFASTTVYDWRGNQIRPAGHINTEFPEDSQNRNVSVYAPGSVALNSTTGLITLDITRAAEISEILTIAGVSVPQSSYWLWSSALDATDYYVWYNRDAGGTDPAIVGKTGIMVAITSANTATQVAAATVSAINTAAGADVTASNLADLITLTNDAVGFATDTVDGGVATTFTFSTIQQGFAPDIEILIPGSANNTIDVDTINGLGTLIVDDNECVWVRINRFAAKTFNTVLTTDTPDTDGAGALYITSIASVPIDQDVFVLWTRVGSALFITHEAQTEDGNVYEELITVVAGAPVNDNEIQGPVLSGAFLQLPLDSRDANEQRMYIVGSGQLELFLNGQYLNRGVDYNEVGTADSASKRIEILQDLEIDDILNFRIDAHGAIYFASAGGGGGGSGTLQDAYDNGRFITVNVGQPIVISGASGKLLSIQGDLDVAGVIDPMGITFSLEGVDPLGIGDYGLWVNATGELIFKRAAFTALNISTDLVRKAGDTMSGTLLLASTDPQGDLTSAARVDAVDTKSVLIKTGNQTGTASSGDLSLRTGTSDTVNSGAITIASGSADLDTGNVSLASGDSANGNTGMATLATGDAAIGDTGGIVINTGDATSGTVGLLLIESGLGLTASGDITVKSGDHITGSTGVVNIASGITDLDTGASGDVALQSGEATNALGGDTGELLIRTGDSAGGASGSLMLNTGDAAGIAGSITLETGSGASGGNILLLATGNLDINSVLLRRSQNSTDFIEQEYIDTITLLGGTTDIAMDLTFDSSVFRGVLIEYVITDTVSGEARIGTLRVVRGDSTVDIDDTFIESVDIGVSWSVSLNVDDVEIGYTTSADDKIMRADIKRFRV